LSSLVRFAHPPVEHNGTIGCWVSSCSIWLKNNTVHGVNQPSIKKTSTEDLKNSESTFMEKL
jgi:hypothetical protein